MLGILLFWIPLVFAVAPLPKLPQQYYTAFNFNVPQWVESGYAPVSEPVEVWFDGVGQKERIEFYGGLDTNVMYMTDIGVIEGWAIYPAGEKLLCGHSIVDSLFGFSSAFPSNLDKYTFTGYKTKYGQQCEEWFLSDVPKGYEGATNNFTFYISATKRQPVAFTYKGTSGMILGFQDSPNYDWFEVEYTKYIPGFLNDSKFIVPSICDWIQPSKGPSMSPPLGLEKLFRTLSSSSLSPDEINSRKLAFRQNLSRIFQHNKDSETYKQQMNPKFSTFMPEELSKTTKHRGFNPEQFRKNMKSAASDKFYKPLSERPEDLPKLVDWRTSGAVSSLKDQGDCGSCWSFGSAAAVESAHFIKHGKPLVTLSEQFLMDCSWDYGNNACYGGDHSSSYEFVIAQGGSWPTEAEYPYAMNANYCTNKTTTSPVKLVSYKYVIGEHAMMDALANHGPVAVAMSTIPMTAFSFYHSGVYSNPLCNPLIPDHIVLAVGYGTDEVGGDYWILKNQWSKYWGEDGYMRISRAWDNCGVDTMGALPIVA